MGAGASAAASPRPSSAVFASSPTAAGGSNRVSSPTAAGGGGDNPPSGLVRATTSKSQKSVQSMDCYDDILAWLDWEFRKNDINKDGYLDYHEFVRFVRSLELNMSIQEVFQFFILADKDNDYRIMYKEIEQDLGLILQKIYKGQPPSKNDWCTMLTPAGDTVWFNKRTSVTSKTLPKELDPAYKPPPDAQVEFVLENTKTFDVALTWLDWEFKKADYDKSGALSMDEFTCFVRGLKIGLSDKEVAQFARLADCNGDGSVEWTEVLELAPFILRKLYAGIEPGPHDWCMILDAQQRRYYLNKRTGQTQEEKPEGFEPPEDELSISIRRKTSIAEFPNEIEADMQAIASASLRRSSGTSSPANDTTTTTTTAEEKHEQSTSLATDPPPHPTPDVGQQPPQQREEESEGPPPTPATATDDNTA